MILGQSNADLLTESIELLRAFNRAGATRAVALDRSKAFDSVWHAGLLDKLKSYGISGQVFGFISSFIINRWFWVVLDGKISQECSVNAGGPHGSILGNDLSDLMMSSIVLLSMLIMLLSTLSMIRSLICSNHSVPPFCRVG